MLLSSYKIHNYLLLVAMSEKQQMAVDLKALCYQEANSQWWLSDRQGPKTTDSRMYFASAVTSRLLLASFSGLWYNVNGCGEIPTACNVVCLSPGIVLFYWAILICRLLWKWFFFLRCNECLIDNNNVFIKIIFLFDMRKL